jgi:hypothetical protein
MSLNVYRYLNADDSSGSKTTDSNGVTVYTLDVDTATTTFGVGLNETPVTYELTGAGLTGSGTVKLQFSCDNGLTWTDAVDSNGNGNAVSYTMSSSTLSEVVKDFQVIGVAQRWNIDGSNTGGTLTIKVIS